MEHIKNEDASWKVGAFQKYLKVIIAKLVGQILCHNILLGRIIEINIEENNRKGRLPLDYVSQEEMTLTAKHLGFQAVNKKYFNS